MYNDFVMQRMVKDYTRLTWHSIRLVHVNHLHPPLFHFQSVFLKYLLMCVLFSANGIDNLQFQLVLNHCRYWQIHIYTCLTTIPRFALREKVTLRLLKLLFQGVDVVEWSRELDVRLSEWCCSVSMVWVQIPSREEQKFDSSKI